MAKLGICLSGGGARGAYQIGALMALRDLGIFKDAIAFSGASIGSINATFAGLNKLEDAKDIWLSFKENPLGEMSKGREKFRKEGLKALENGLFPLTKLEEVLDQNIIPFTSESKDVFVAVSETGDATKTDLELIKSAFDYYIRNDEKLHYVSMRTLTKHDQVTTLLASCAIPFIFPPIIKDNRKYRDGGYFDNTPIQPLIDYGCDEIICIRISIISTLWAVRAKNPKLVIHEIKSNSYLGGILDFSPEHSRELYDLGYQDTLNYFNKRKAMNGTYL